VAFTEQVDLKQTVSRHDCIVTATRFELLVHRAQLSQGTLWDCVLKAGSAFSWPDDSDRSCSRQGFLWRNGQGALAHGSVGSDGDPVGEAGARRRVAVIIKDAKFARLRVKATNNKALRPDVPVIMITAYGDAETKRKALQNGAEALLTKPIDFTMLPNEIDTRVERAA
jgi:hypothetical protein